MSNDHKDLNFKTQLGITATVQRETIEATNENRRLIELGLSFPQADDEKFHHLRHYRYFGSAAVHIYFAEAVRQLDFVSQVQPLHLYKCPQVLAAKAFDDLLGEMKKSFGHSRPRLRSGF
jgi:hypothetical protein